MAKGTKKEGHLKVVVLTRRNDYGARGVGGIGLAGISTAVTAAVFHPSGVRVGRLPVTIEDLLAAPA